MNTPKASELYALNGRIVWHINYISIKLFLKNLKNKCLVFNKNNTRHANKLKSIAHTQEKKQSIENVPEEA